MKKSWSTALLAGLLCAALAVPAQALTRPTQAGAYLDPAQVAPQFQITPRTEERQAILPITDGDCDGDDKADCFYPGARRYEVTYTPETLTLGQRYVVLLKGGEGLSMAHMLYLYRATVTQEDVENGHLTFDIYPYAMQPGTLLLQGEGWDKPVTVATLLPFSPHVLGDVDGDGAVTMLDEMSVLQQISGQLALTGPGLAAADANGDGSVTVADAMLVLQHIVSGTPLG